MTMVWVILPHATRGRKGSFAVSEIRPCFSASLLVFFVVAPGALVELRPETAEQAESSIR
jgi:hypothetical protein